MAKCRETIEQKIKNQREKNQVKALFLQELVTAHAYCPQLIAAEELKEMYTALGKEEKLNRSTKKILEVLKPSILAL